MKFNGEKNGIVSSHNEWDPLEEIIVGSPQGANLPKIDISLKQFYELNDTQVAKAEVGKVPQRVIEETEEDIADFITALQRQGVVVRRPAEWDFNKEYSTPDWSGTGLFSLMPRDCLLVIGKKIIETPMPCRTRYFETMPFRALLLEYFSKGAEWVSAPKPRLLDRNYNFELDRLDNYEPLFDAANVLRCGKDLFFNVNRTGNTLGLQWLQSIVGAEYRVHAVNVSSDHIDTTIVPLGPGKVLINPARVKPEEVPPLFKEWEIIWSTPMVTQGHEFSYPMATQWIGMNVLVVKPQTVMIEERQTGLIDLLDKHGVEVIPLRYRHGRTFGGGFHCITLDVRRSGTLQSYFN